MVSSKVLTLVLLTCAFVMFFGMMVFGMQWFYQTLEGITPEGIPLKAVSLGALEASASEAIPPLKEVSSVVPSQLFPVRNWNESDLDLTAQAAISLQINNSQGQDKVLFHKNEDAKLPIASLTKLMTALIVLERYDLDQKVTISPEAMTQVGEQGSLQQGQVLSVKNLLYITLIESSNRSAYALAQVMGVDAFLQAMNDRAVKLGMTSTHFQDATGLSPDSYSTASDIALLSEYLFLHQPLFNEIVGYQQYNLYLSDGSLHHTLVSTNKLLGQVPGVIGGKTGWTDIARGCLMVIQQGSAPGSYFIHVVLGADDRFLQAQRMIDWEQAAYQFNL